MSDAARMWCWSFLADPHLLRLLVEQEPPPYTVRFVAERLPGSALAPAEGRALAHRRLNDAGVFDNIPPHLAWARALGVLRADPEPPAALSLAQVFGLPELLPELLPPPPPPPPPGVHAEAPLRAERVDLVEAHAHFRGSMPYVAMWAGWLFDERWRAAVRGPRYELRADGWHQTWAELMRLCASHPRCPSPPSSASLSQLAEHAGLWLRQLTRVLFGRSPPSRFVLPTAQTLAVALTLRRELHLQPGRRTPGLKSFVDSFDRSARAQKRGRAEADLLRQQTRVILDRFAEDGVGVLELRPTFERTAVELHSRLRQIVLGYLDHLRTAEKPVQLGLILSLFKGEQAGRLAPNERAAVWLEQLEGLLELLEREPLYRMLVVGVDAAGQERGCPLGLFAPVLDRLRRWHTAHGVHRSHPGLRFPMGWFTPDAREPEVALEPEAALDRLLDGARGAHWPGWLRLGVTLHAGEDFVDPLTGLRQIHEALCTLDLSGGDRLGHALAAAMSPELLDEWLRRKLAAADHNTSARDAADHPIRLDSAGLFSLHKPRGEHIADLAWAAGLLQGSQRAWALAQLSATLSRAWLGAEAELHRALQPERPGELRLPGLLYDQPPGHDALEWVPQHPTAREVFETLRREVLAELARRGVVIETCPTSNRVVMNLDTAPAVQLLREQPEYGLKLLICTDDPGLFGVWPKEERERLENSFHPTHQEPLTRALNHTLTRSGELLFTRR